jgi:UDP-2-acetamido-2-deoxy-ribo-hexuluronate aminotransferase|tara:strand:+ start:5210 stop:6328 length:1119 start_codon:yes stop_codon:yes gene_type:complete
MQFIDLKTQQSKIRLGIDSRFAKVLDHGQYIMGPEVYELEKKLAQYVGVKHCISCSSGTDALLILLMSKNIGPGDAVFTTPFTYIATSEVITLLGATPIFVDIYKSTYNLNPSELEKSISYAKQKNLSPKAIISVDLFGLPARYRLINKFAKEHNLFLIEDSAQGFGGSIKKIKSGSFGDASTTSFFPAKPLGCYGDGGAMFTDSDSIAEIAVSIRNHGAGEDKYDNVRLGLNGRLDTLQACVLLEKLKIFDHELVLREKIAQFYSSNISDKYITPYIPKNYQSSWAQYSIMLPKSINRKMLINELKKNNIPCMVYYSIPLHLQKVFFPLNYKQGDFPIAEKVSSQIISLPMHPYMDTQNQSSIINVLNNFK